MPDNNELLEQFFQLHSQQTQLETMIQSPTTPNRDLLESALSQAQEKIASLTAETEVQEGLASLLQPVQEELSQLDSLQPFVETGLIDAADIEARKAAIGERLSSDERTAIAWRIIHGQAFAKVTTIDIASVETTPEQAFEASESETSAEKQKPDIKLTIRDGAILIGKNGKFVKTSEAFQEKQKDYSEERIAFLKALVKFQGEMVPVGVLRQEAFGDADVPRETIRQIKTWMEKLTHRRSPLVVHNGKRGLASQYGIIDFNIELVTEAVTRRMPVVVTSTSDDAVAPRIPTQRVPEASPAVADVPETSPKSDEQICNVPFPLSLFESSLVATFLDKNATYLEAKGITPLSPEIASKLDSKITDKIKMSAIAHTPFSNLAEYRLDALTRLKRFFDDESLVLDTVGDMSTHDDRYELFSYLFDLEGEDRWVTLEELVTAQRSVQSVIQTGKFDGYRIVKTRSVVEIETPSGVKVFEEADALGSLALGSAKIEVEELPTPIVEAELDETSQVDIELQALPEDQEITLQESVSDVEEAETWLSPIKADINDVIDILDDKGILTDDEMTAHTASLRYPESRKYGTVEAVKRLESAGIISLKGIRKDKIGDVTLNRVQRVAMLMFNTNKQIFAHRGRRVKVLAEIEAALKARYSSEQDM